MANPVEESVHKSRSSAGAKKLRANNSHPACFSSGDHVLFDRGVDNRQTDKNSNNGYNPFFHPSKRRLKRTPKGLGHPSTWNKTGFYQLVWHDQSIDSLSIPPTGAGKFPGCEHYIQ